MASRRSRYSVGSIDFILPEGALGLYLALMSMSRMESSLSVSLFPGITRHPPPLWQLAEIRSLRKREISETLASNSASTAWLYILINVSGSRSITHRISDERFKVSLHEYLAISFSPDWGLSETHVPDPLGKAPLLIA